MRSNPFVGPKPLGAQNPVHGRDRELRELRNLLTSERIVLLHSPSGAGKSSLINGRGGLIDTLDERFDVWVPARVNSLPADEKRELPNRFLWSVMYEFERQFNEGKPKEPPAGVTLKQYVDLRRQTRKPTVLMFDQFEEILRVDALKQGPKREFFQQAGELLLDEYIWALFVLREDYLAPLEPYRRLIPTHLRNRYRLDLLSADDARLAMMKTAADGDREFTDDAAGRLARDLSETRIQTLAGMEVVEGPVQPLILQVACYRLWEEAEKAGGDSPIGIEEVKRFGKVTEALSEYYSSNVKAVAGDDFGVEWAVRDWFGERLIVGGIRSQVQQGSEGLDPLLVERLVKTHMVRADERGSSVWYELAHDRLIDPIVQSNAERSKCADFGAYYANQVASIAGGDKGQERLIRNWVEDLIQNSRRERGDLEERYVAGLKKAGLIRELAEGWYELVHSRLKAPLLRDNESWRESNLLPFQKTAWIWRKDRPKGLLMTSGAQIRDARTAAKQQLLSAYEKEFIEESGDRLSKKRWLTFAIVAGVIATALASLLADNRRRELNRMASVALSRLAGSVAVRLKESKPALAAVLAAQSVQFANTYESRSAMLSVHLQEPDVLQYLHGVSHVAASSDDSVQAEVRGKRITIRHNGKAIELAEAPEKILDMAFRPGSKDLAIVFKNSIRLVTFSEPGKEVRLDAKFPILAMAFRPDGGVLAVRTTAGPVQIWHLPSHRGEPGQISMGVYSGRDEYFPNLVAYSADGMLLAVADDDGMVRLWDAGADRLLGSVKANAMSLSFHSRLRLMAMATQDGAAVEVVDVSNPGNLVRMPMVSEPDIAGYMVAFQPGSDVLAAAGDFGIQFWKMNSVHVAKKPIAKLAQSFAMRIALTRTGRAILSNIDAGNAIVRKIPAAPVEASAIAIHPKSGELVRAWNDWLFMGDKKFQWPANRVVTKMLVRRLSMDSEGSVLAAVQDDGRVTLFDGRNLSIGATILERGDFHKTAAFHPSKKILATVGRPDQKEVFCLWDVSNIRNPKLMASALGQGGSRSDRVPISFSVDGNLLAVNHQSNVIGLWDVSDPGHPKLKRTVDLPKGVIELAFHPRQKVLALAYTDGSVEFRDLQRNVVRESEALSDAGASRIGFDLEGDRVVTAQTGGSIVLWDFEKGDQLAELKNAGANQIVISHDGKRLAAIGPDDMARVWNIETNVESLCARANRNMSLAEWKLYIGDDVEYEKTCEALPAGEGVTGNERVGWLRKWARKIGW